jgi:hypothetical protein
MSELGWKLAERAGFINKTSQLRGTICSRGALLRLTRAGAPAPKDFGVAGMGVPGPRSAFARQLPASLASYAGTRRRDRPDWPMPASPPVDSGMNDRNMKTKAALEAPGAKHPASASAQKPWRAKPDLHHCDQSCRREIGLLTPALSATFERRGSRAPRLNACKHERRQRAR